MAALSSLPSRPAPAAGAPGAGLDARSLDALRTQAGRDPRAAARQVATQFEAHFMEEVFKGLRRAMAPGEEGGAGGSGNGGDGGGQATFTGMLDAQFARQFAGRPGGLADMIERQLARQMQAQADAAGTTAGGAAGGVSGAVPAAARALNFPAMPALPGKDLPTITPATQAPKAGAASVASAVNAVNAETAAAVAPGRSRSGASGEFLRRMLPHAQAAERATGVPASFILGQAALESGWGKGEIRHADGSPSFNLFGVKAGSAWRGEVAVTATTEYEGGQPVRRQERFRRYESYAHAFTDFARLLTGSPRYAGALKEADSPERFASAMQRAGYATDPRYADKLARTIHLARAVQGAGESMQAQAAVKAPTDVLASAATPGTGSRA